MLICQMVPEGNPLHILVQLWTSSIHGSLFIQPPVANLATVSKIPYASSCPTYGHSDHASTTSGMEGKTKCNNGNIGSPWRTADESWVR